MNDTIVTIGRYIASHEDVDEKELKALARKEKQRLLKDVISRVERLKAEHMEAALFYDDIKERERAYRTKEITVAEYENNPVRKAYQDYAINISYITGELGIPCFIEALFLTPENYHETVDNAILRAEKVIKQLQKVIKVEPDALTLIVKGIVPAICDIGYMLFSPDEWNATRDYFESTQEKIALILDQIQDPSTDEKNDPLYAEIKELEEALRQKLKEEYSRGYKKDQATYITEAILSRIFPADKTAIRRAMGTQLDLSDNLAGYIYLPNGVINQFVKQTLNNPQNVAAMKKGIVSIQPNLVTQDISITYSGNDGTIATIELSRTKELFKERVRGGAKLYNFFLQKSNEQNGREITTFMLQDLIENGLYSNKDSAYTGIRKITDKMMAMSIEGTQVVYDGKNKKQTRNAKAVIVSQRDISYNACSISLPQLIRNNTKYITILPAWSYSLLENGFMLLDYIYYLARQNADTLTEKHCFNVSLEAVRVHLGLPTPDRAGANPGRLIIEPIEAAIENIEARNNGEIMITPIYKNADYSNVHEFLEGYLEIRLDEKAEKHMSEIAKRQEKKIKAAIKKKEQAELKARERAELRNEKQLKLPTK